MGWLSGPVIRVDFCCTLGFQIHTILQIHIFFLSFFFSPCTLCLSAVFWLFVIGILKLVWVTLNQQFYHFGLHLTCFRKAMLFFLLIMEINILKKGINFSFSSLFFFFFSILSISLSRTLFIFFKKKFSI